MIRKFIPLLLLTVLLQSYVPAPGAPRAYATDAESGSGLPARSGAQIAELWKKLMHPEADYSNPYSKTPVASSPYAAGALRQDYIQDGVNAVNFYRFIGGLPADVTADASLNAKAQYGSVLLAASGQFSHYPGQPADMPDSFYKQGADSTSTSNIYSSYGYNDHIVSRSVEAYMEDSDVGNLDRVGHRRWILNPPLKKIGFGQAEGDDGWSYSALQIFDQSRKETVDYRYIAYPAEGSFPVEVFKGNYAWSVSINPDEYADPVMKNVKVSLKRLNDGKAWTLTSANNKATVNGAYFNAENEYYGSGPAIIFRPNGIEAYKAGDRFQVTITGLKSTAGASRTIQYEVAFMSADNYVPAPEAMKTKFTDIGKHWAKATIEWAAGEGIVSDVNGPFRPNDDVKEEEFLKMFIASLGIEVPAPGADERWSANYYDYAADNGYNLRGSEDEDERLLPITRLSVAELIASAAGQPYTGDAAIRYLLDNGYSQGKSAATVEGYEGSAPLTRAEAAQFIRNLIEAGYDL